MEHSFTLLPHSEVEIKAKIPFAEFEADARHAEALASDEVEIPGFRKGKAPRNLVLKHVGEMEIYERAADLAVRRVYPDILERVKKDQEAAGVSFVPLGAPSIAVTKLAPGNDFEFTARLARFPDVVLPDWRQIAFRIRKEKKEQGVSEEELEKALGWFRESRATLASVDRPAQTGDKIEINFVIRRDGVLIEGGESKNHPLILGAGRFIPGFEDQLVGMKSGDQKSFEIQAPSDWREKQIAGTLLAVEVRMNGVQERKIPGLTDEFARSVGDFSDAEALRSSVRDGMRKEKEEKETQRIRLLMIDRIAQAARIDLPDILIESELDAMVRELCSGIAEMQMSWQDYLAHIQKNEEDIRREWRGQAEQRSRVSACLAAIADQEKIEPTDAEVSERADQYLRQFRSAEEAEKSIDPERLREYTRGVLRNEKVFELLESV
ncbi:MAG: trigger factor [Candidatus Sungbacteria bacterium]|nr:trigger factor [Candidatus Sungbacteria bacterium]